MQSYEQGLIQSSEQRSEQQVNARVNKIKERQKSIVSDNFLNENWSPDKKRFCGTMKAFERRRLFTKLSFFSIG